LSAIRDLKGRKRWYWWKGYVMQIAFSKQVGIIYRRESGKVRWRKWGEAKGNLELAHGFEYQLRITSLYFPLTSYIDLLKGVDLDAFVEVVIPQRVSSKDLMNDAVSGTYFIADFTKNQVARYTSGLKTSARISIKLKVR
jgi:hypothetical protein